MKKYSVKLCYTTYLYEEVEAENEQEAIEAAKCAVDGYDDIAYQETLVGNLSYDEAEVGEIDENGFVQELKFL